MLKSAFLSRRRVMAAMLCAALVASGCSDDATTSSTATTVTSPTQPSSTSTPDATVVDGSDGVTDAFPVTVEHKFGTTTIAAAPERVVTIGWNDQDAVLALGVVPLAYRGWFEEYPTFPWVVDALGGATMQVMEDEIDPEFVASLKPDLIIAVYDTVDRSTYDVYAQIAPTVVQSGDYADEEMPWDEQTRLIGRALGRSEAAEALVTDLQADIAAAASDHPGMADLVLVANFYPDLGTGEQWLLGHGDPRRQLFDRLGFGVQADTGAVGLEQVGLLDRDVLVVNGVSRADWLAATPVGATLDVVTEGRAIFIADDSPVSGALAYGSALSLAYALDQLLEPLAAAADDDPATPASDL